jgi:hypothetical protein
VIKNVCIHVENEQPLLCDLYELPTQADAGLVCTNVRMLDGKKPIFVDQTASTFFFPYHVVRFLEIPEREMAAHRAAPRRSTSAQATTDGQDDAAYEASADADPGEPESLLPVAVGAPEAAPDDEDLELEIDEGFLQRIRDI